MAKKANALIHESSPYLLQHAYNPVDWKPWSEESLILAREENKPLVISIGYAACHWCHVMEHESFEDPEVAEVMNTHFINIKVDREERPDVDQVYMDALQLMTGRGGWPLNIVALPDGRPFWGTTYLPPGEWKNILGQLKELYKKDRAKVTEYAEKLTAGVRAMDLLEHEGKGKSNLISSLRESISKWTTHFDDMNGGFRGAPKFMMPVIYDFLMHYAKATNDGEIEGHVHLTLKKMAFGGLYDHFGGGFARYSVDTRWHVPHFEKMLYDNAQLIALYAQAYGKQPDELYKQCIEETIAFLNRELKNKEHGYYSSLDADSLDEDGKLEEGVFYRWELDELKEHLADDFKIAQLYYNFNEEGHWEKGFYVPIRTHSAAEIAKQLNISEQELGKKIEAIKTKLHKVRYKRPKPRLDDKVLCSWNALLVQALFKAGRHLKSEEYSQMALNTLEYLDSHHFIEGCVFRTRGDRNQGIKGFLDDYVGMVLCFLDAYEDTFSETWLSKAMDLFQIVIEKFYDEKTGLFFYTASDETPLIRRTKETRDNVIPSSNSFVLQALFRLDRYFPSEGFKAYYNRMTAYLQSMVTEPYAYANWLHLVLMEELPFYEIAVVGPKVRSWSRELQSHYTPNAIYAGTEKTSELALLNQRYQPGKTLVYLCEKGSCKQPTESIEEVINSI